MTKKDKPTTSTQPVSHKEQERQARYEAAQRGETVVVQQRDRETKKAQVPGNLTNLFRRHDVSLVEVATEVRTFSFKGRTF